MVNFLVILGICVICGLLIFLTVRFSKHKELILKIYGLIFTVIYCLRLFDYDFIDNIVGMNTGVLTSGMLGFMVLLRWLTLASVLIMIVTPFAKIRTFKNLLALVVPVIVILNVGFFFQHLICFEGAGANVLSYRSIQFALETVFLGAGAAVYLFWFIKDKAYKEVKSNLKYMAIIFPCLLLAIMPPSTLQIWFGQGLGEVEDFNLLHRMILYISIIIPVAIYLGFRKKDEHLKRWTLIILSVAMMIQYIYPMFYKTIGWTSLPLHLCNTAVFLIFIAYAFKIKSVYYFTYFVNVIGALIAMVMPETSGDVLMMGNMRFWYNHIFVLFLPILGMSLKIFTRPNLKMMRGAIYIFSIYFVCMIFANSIINTFASVDYFYLQGEVITKHLTFLRDIQINHQLAVTINGVRYMTYWLYDILIYIGYIFLMFMIWLGYSGLYRVEDHYSELIAIKRQDMLEISKFKKELGGRPMNSPINPSGEDKIIISHFSKVYGLNKFKTVEDFNLEVKKGEVFGFLGHNGAGKSTVIKSMVGIQSITEGKIEVCGYDIAKQPREAKMQIGYVSDNHAVYENLTGREYVNYVADLYMVTKEDRDSRLEKFVKMFSLEGAFDQQIKSYSHGMKQKLVVIAALIHNPKAWILDEPLTGLDPTSAYQIKECMRQHADNGNIVFFSSHIIEVVEKICDRIAIIRKGKLQGVFSVKELAEKGVDLEELYLSYVEDDKEKQESIKVKLINDSKKTTTKSKRKQNV